MCRSMKLRRMDRESRAHVGSQRLLALFSDVILANFSGTKTSAGCDPLDLCGSAPADPNCVWTLGQERVKCDPLDRCGSASTPSTEPDTNGTVVSTDGRTMYVGSRDKLAFKAKVKARRSRSLTDISGGLIATSFSPFSYAVRTTSNSPTGWNCGNTPSVPGVGRSDRSQAVIEDTQPEPAYAPPADAAAVQSGSMRLRCPAYNPVSVPIRGAVEDTPFTPTSARKPRLSAIASPPRGS